MQHRSSISSILTPCRPLLYPTSPSPTTTYISLPHTYTLQQLKTLSSYLCPNVKIAGVDFRQEVDEGYGKIRYKVVAVKGQLLGSEKGEKGKKVEERGKDGWVRLEWQVGVGVMQPDVRGNEIQGQLRNRMIDSIVMLDSRNNYLQQQQISLQTLSHCRIEHMPITSYIQKPTKNKLFVSSIPIKLLLPKQQAYNKSYILQLIAGDLSQAIGIMIQNCLSVRVVEWHQGLVPIQNYYAAVGQRDPQFQKFISKQQQPLKPTPTPDKNTKNSNKQANVNNKNMQIAALVLFLVIVVGSYLALKFM